MALVESAQAAAHTKGTYLAAQDARASSRQDHKTAVIAVAHSMIIADSGMDELGGNYLIERPNKYACQLRLVKQLDVWATMLP